MAMGRQGSALVWGEPNIPTPVKGREALLIKEVFTPQQRSCTNKRRPPFMSSCWSDHSLFLPFQSCTMHHRGAEQSQYRNDARSICAIVTPDAVLMR